MDIAHNCFALVGNGGSPLVDLEDGKVLSMHYAAHYTPGPDGLKSGRAMPLSGLIDRPFLTSGTGLETPEASPPAASPERIREIAGRVAASKEVAGSSAVASWLGTLLC